MHHPTRKKLMMEGSCSQETLKFATVRSSRATSENTKFICVGNIYLIKDAICVPSSFSTFPYIVYCMSLSTRLDLIVMMLLTAYVTHLPSQVGHDAFRMPRLRAIRPTIAMHVSQIKKCGHEFVVTFFTSELSD